MRAISNTGEVFTRINTYFPAKMSVIGNPPMNRQMKTNMLATSLVLSLGLSVAFADDFKTIDGKEYKNATISRVEPDGIVLITKSGISKVYFTELPKDVQERFHYDAAKAAEFTSQTTEKIDQLLQQRAEKAQQRAGETAKYWSENPTPTTTGSPWKFA